MPPLTLSELDAFREWYEAELAKLKARMVPGKAALAAHVYAYAKGLESTHSPFEAITLPALPSRLSIAQRRAI